MANPYLWFSAMLLAGMDGIKNKIKPGESLDKNLFHLSAAEQKKVKFVPSSLDGSLAALEADHDFLLQGGVFTEQFLDNYTSLKREQMDAVRLRPHPHEFSLYFNA
jgi:glutamine synthetase